MMMILIIMVIMIIIMIMIIKIMIKIGKWKVTRSVYEGNRQYTQLKRRIKKTRRTRRKNSKKKKMQIMVLNTFPSSFTPSFTFILHSFLSLHPSLLPFPSSFTPSFTFILHSFLHLHLSLLPLPSSFTPSKSPPQPSSNTHSSISQTHILTCT